MHFSQLVLYEVQITTADITLADGVWWLPQSASWILFLIFSSLQIDEWALDNIRDVESSPGFSRKQEKN